MARPVFHKTSGRVTELRAVDEGAVPASAPATSRLFVLPVATRRWVSTDNRRAVKKKPGVLGGIIFPDAVFASHQILSSNKSFHMGLKKMFCEGYGFVRGMGRFILVRIVSNSFILYSI